MREQRQGVDDARLSAEAFGLVALVKALLGHILVSKLATGVGLVGRLGGLLRPQETGMLALTAGP